MSNPAASQRLDRLEGYLHEDPDNIALLADAFDVALAAGEWARAERHLRHAQALAREDASWTLREAHWLLAQQCLDEADGVLQALAARGDSPAELRPVLAHDLAFVALRRGDFAGGHGVLAPLMESLSPAEAADPALQVLWLRLLHRLDRLDEAMAWATARSQARQLPAAAAGVASLIALDASDYAHGVQWADFALQQDPRQMEALVARSSLALAQRDPALARRLLDVALQHNPKDGRAWSALGFADLVEQQLPAARKSFEQALCFMPDHVGTWHGAGWAALLQQDPTGAQQAFESALALDRNFAESHGGLAVVLTMQGRRTQAQESIDRAMRLDRDNLSARYAQAILNGEAGDARALRRLAQRLLGGRAAPLGGSLLDLLSTAPLDDGTG